MGFSQSLQLWPPTNIVFDSLEPVTAHYDLYKKAGILHRDISLENLMVDANNHRRGILIDLDIAARIRDGDKVLQPAMTYAGTLGFRSIDLLEEGTHYPTRAMYRDDLESFFYVLYYIQTFYHDGNRLPIHDRTGWWNLFGDDVESLGGQKRGWLISTSIPDSAPTSEWLVPLHELIKHAYQARRDFRKRKEAYRNSKRIGDRDGDGDGDHEVETTAQFGEWGPSEEETLDGRLTFKSFMNLIQ